MFGQSDIQLKALPVNKEAIEEELEGDAWEEEADFADDLVDGCGFTDEIKATEVTPSGTMGQQQPLGGTARGAAARRRECKLLAKAARALRTLQARVRQIEIREGSARRGLNLVAQLCHKVHWRRDGRRALLLKHSARTIQRTWRDYNRYSADVAWRILLSPSDSKYRKDLHGNNKIKDSQLQEPHSAKKKATRFGGLADVVAQAKEKAIAEENAEADAKEAAAKKLGFLVGERVEAKFGGMSLYFPAKVIRPSEKVPRAYMLKYDDGDVENAVPRALIRRPGEDHLPEDDDVDNSVQGGATDLNNASKSSEDVSDPGVAAAAAAAADDAHAASDKPPAVFSADTATSIAVAAGTSIGRPESTNVNILPGAASKSAAIDSGTTASDQGNDKSDENALDDVFAFVATKIPASSAWLTSIDLSAVPLDQRPTVAQQLVVWETYAVRLQTRARMKLARSINFRRLDALERVGSYMLSLLVRLRLRACAELIGTLSSHYPLEDLESRISTKNFSYVPVESASTSPEVQFAATSESTGYSTLESTTPPAPQAVSSLSLQVVPEWVATAEEEFNRLAKALNLSAPTTLWWRSAKSPFRRPLTPGLNEQTPTMTSLRAARISPLCGAQCGLTLSGGAATTPLDGFQPSQAKGLWWQRPGGFPGQAGFGGMDSRLDKDPTKAPTAAAEAARLRATRALGAAADANATTHDNNTFTASNYRAAPESLTVDERPQNESSNHHPYNDSKNDGAAGTSTEHAYNDASSEPGHGALAVVGSDHVIINNFGPAPVVRALNSLRPTEAAQVPALQLQEDKQKTQAQLLEGKKAKGSPMESELNPNSRAAAAAAVASAPRSWVPPLWAPLPSVLQLWSGSTTHVIVTSPSFTAAAVRSLARAIRLASQAPAVTSSSVTSINMNGSKSNSSSSSSSAFAESSSSSTRLVGALSGQQQYHQDPTGGWQLEGSGADGPGWDRTLSILGNKSSSGGSLDNSQIIHNSSGNGSSSANSVRALNTNNSDDNGTKGHDWLQDVHSINLPPPLAVTEPRPAAATAGALAAAPVVGPASALGKMESLHLSCRNLSCNGLIALVELLLYPPRPRTAANGSQINGVAAETNAAVEERRAYARSAAVTVKAEAVATSAGLAAPTATSNGPMTSNLPSAADATASPFKMVSPARKNQAMPQENQDNDEFSLALSPSLSLSPSSSSSSAGTGKSSDTLFPTHFALAPGPSQPPVSFGTGITRDILPMNPSVRAATLHTLSLSVRLGASCCLYSHANSRL